MNYTGLLSGNLPDQLAQANFLNLNLADLRLLAASGPCKIYIYINKYKLLFFFFSYLDSDNQLNGAKAYFNLEPRLVTADLAGVYHYVSTRNNDFSNRDQKGQIIVQPYTFQNQLIGQNLFIAQIE